LGFAKVRCRRPALLDGHLHGVILNSDQVSITPRSVRRSLSNDRRATFHGLDRRSYDNAMWESFFATPECELLDRSRSRIATRPVVKVRFFDSLLMSGSKTPIQRGGPFSCGHTVMRPERERARSMCT
jgi:hypothetical protein